MATGRLRVGALGVATLFAVAACSGGFGGAPASAPASAAQSEAPPPSAEASAEASPSEAAAEPVTLSFLIGEVEANVTSAHALADAYTKLHPNVTFEYETAPSGLEGDNLVKTRLATGTMTDIFWYNSGALIQPLDPAKTMVDVSGEPWIADLSESFIQTVSVGDQIFGAPAGTAMGGGVLYNKKVFADNGISVPKTWAEFQANNDKLKAAGVTPVGATWGGTDSWTSQLLVLANHCNVVAEMPDFVEQYTANKIHNADSPALKGYQRLQEGYEKGWWNEDFQADTFDKGLTRLATGEFAQFPMLTFALATIATNNPEAIDDIGFFGQPGDDAAKNCATMWMPSAVYIANTSQHQDVAKDFLGFIASPEGAAALTAAVPPTGPYVIKGATLPDDVMAGVKDIQPYLDNNANEPAIEFTTPVKGADLANYTVSVGSGLMSATEAAEGYDRDVAKAAKQLGLPGW